MKEIKDKTIEFRLTENEKEKIYAYAKSHNMKVSEVIRALCQQIFMEGTK